MSYEKAAQKVMDYVFSAHLIRKLVMHNGVELEGHFKPVWTPNAAEQIGEVIRQTTNNGLKE